MVYKIKILFWLVTLGISGFLIHSVMYLSLLVYPFSKKIYRRMNCWSAGSIWGLWRYIIFDFQKTPLYFSGDEIAEGENAILISNHQSWSDILVALSVTKKAKMTANLKWMAKDSLKYVPLIGWGMCFIDCIFLKRDWSKDKKAIEKTFNHIIANDVPFWLAIFPEGTRKNPQKLAKNQRFSKQRSLPVWNHVMNPKPKGLSASIQGLRPKLDAMYSLSIHYHDAKVPTPGEMFAGEVSGIDIRVKKIHKEQIDALATDQQVKKMLYEDFAEKEKWLEAKKQESSGVSARHEA